MPHLNKIINDNKEEPLPTPDGKTIFPLGIACGMFPEVFEINDEEWRERHCFSTWGVNLDNNQNVFANSKVAHDENLDLTGMVGDKSDNRLVLEANDNIDKNVFEIDDGEKENNNAAGVLEL